jgi:hypothetical protein
MLAYVFWHRPAHPDDALASYEHAHLAFHRSLKHNRPVGLLGSAVFGLPTIPWLADEHDDDEQVYDTFSAGFEDWYLLTDFAALGVLNEAAVGRGHRSPHDEVARRYGGGAGAVYGLIEGDRRTDLLGAATSAVWVSRPPGSPKRGIADLLGDGVRPGEASLWRRHLVLGPAPEFCLLACESVELSGPSGVASARLPADWAATAVEREIIWHG